VTTSGVPHGILSTASKLWARDTGFSGPEIIGFFSDYGDNMPEYGVAEGAGSRAGIFESCVKRLAPADQWRALLDLCDYDEAMKYEPPAEADVERLRSRLLGQQSPVAASGMQTLSQVSWGNVHADWRRVSEQATGDPEGAITATRTLIETICKHIIEAHGGEAPSDGDLNKLYKAASKLLSLAPEQHAEQVFKMILSGCNSIVGGLAAVRNAYGDAHGKGSKYVKPSARHARLAVNVGFSLAEFLLATHLAREGAAATTS
jgi:hypothetical protein